jgi:hypothetical protein
VANPTFQNCAIIESNLAGAPRLLVRDEARRFSAGPTQSEGGSTPEADRPNGLIETTRIATGVPLASPTLGTTNSITVVGSTWARLSRAGNSRDLVDWLPARLTRRPSLAWMLAVICN